MDDELKSERELQFARGAARTVELLPSPETAQRLREARRWTAEFEDVLAQAQRALGGTPRPSDRVKVPAEAVRVLPAEIGYWRERAGKLETLASSRMTLEAAIPANLERFHALERLAQDLERLGVVFPLVRARRQQASELLPRSTAGEAARAWEDAATAILDAGACPAYGGRIRSLKPIEGLVPLRLNPRNGLWDFHHVASGARPALDGQGHLQVGPETGLVLVLVPGAVAVIGAQAIDAQASRHDPDASRTEAPWTAELAPYFMAAHELTQGQWQRMGGESASLCAAGRRLNPDPRATRARPLESVSALECERLLALHGLELPTEAQWEHAARGGSESRYIFGPKPSTIARAANAREIDDGYARTAPVGSREPNGFGIHDVLGNVREWCADAISDSQDRPAIAPETGLREPQAPRDRVVRGGSYDTPPEDLRASARRGVHPSNSDRFVGVRPARSLP